MVLARLKACMLVLKCGLDEISGVVSGAGSMWLVS